LLHGYFFRVFRSFFMTIFYTVPKLAEALGTDQDKVLSFIRSGELAAVNIARNPQGARPRWRISQQELDRFLASRQSQPPAPPAKRKRKPEGVIEFYS
jgi:Helix-turn-helix domain